MRSGTTDMDIIEGTETPPTSVLTCFISMIGIMNGEQVVAIIILTSIDTFAKYDCSIDN